MARTPSNMVALGTKAPDFSLPNVVSGTTVSLQDIKSDRATLVMFICNHCPFVKHVMDELVQLGRDYIPKGVSVIAISSNDAEQYPDDSPEEMKKLAQEKSFPFPYLYDETQQVAKAFDAACTPDFYILDGSLSIVYRGQLDDSRPGNDVPVTGKDIRTALDALLSGSPVSQEQRPSLGCNIKWK
nr:thioredoxin family protein [Paenibacillus turpanensis]